MKPFSALSSSSDGQRRQYFLRSCNPQTGSHSNNLIKIENVQIGNQSSPSPARSSSSSISNASNPNSSLTGSHFLDRGQYTWGFKTDEMLHIVPRSPSLATTIPISNPHSSPMSSRIYSWTNNSQISQGYGQQQQQFQATITPPTTPYRGSPIIQTNRPRVISGCTPAAGRQPAPPANLDIWAYRTPPSTLSPEISRRTIIGPIFRTEETFNGYPKVKAAYERLKAANLPDNYSGYWHSDEEMVFKYIYMVHMKPKRPLAPMRYKTDYDEVYPPNLKVDPLRHRNWRSIRDKVRHMENDGGLGLYLTQIL